MLVSPSDEEALEDDFDVKLLSNRATVEKESPFAGASRSVHQHL
jgi:hypothetical protein